MTNATQRREVAHTILAQLRADGPLGVLAACGARDFLALDSDSYGLGGLDFRVTITSPRTRHHVRVLLAADDTYTVLRLKVKRGSYEVEEEERHEGVYADQLAAVVYGTCNK